MKLPRDLSGAELAKALQRVGYQVTRQAGSHMRLPAAQPAQQPITIPSHHQLTAATLATIHRAVAEQLTVRREELRRRQFA